MCIFFFFTFFISGIHKQDSNKSLMNGIGHMSADSPYAAIKTQPPPAVSVVTFRWEKRQNNHINDSISVGAPGRYRELCLLCCAIARIDV